MILGAAISPDGRIALSGGADSTLKLWDVASGKELRTLRGHTDAVWSVAFLPDGRTALSGSCDGTLKLWNLATGKELGTLRGHNLAVYDVAISPIRQFAISGSADKTLMAWSLVGAKELYTFTGNESHIENVAISADGRMAVSGETLNVWNFACPVRSRELEPLVARAEDILGSNPNDGASHAVLGEWFAFRGANAMAIERLEKARALGAAVSPLTLARCYWELGKLPEAAREFQQALDHKDAPADYLKLCLGAVTCNLPTVPKPALPPDRILPVP